MPNYYIVYIMPKVRSFVDFFQSPHFQIIYLKMAYRTKSSKSYSDLGESFNPV